MGLKVKHITDSTSQIMDYKKQTKSYVHLAYDESYSMFSAMIYYGRLIDPAIIKIDPRIILEKTCKFSDSNASSYDARIGSAREIVPHLDFATIYKPKDEIKSLWAFKYYKRQKQAEILVKNEIPLNYIQEILIPENFDDSTINTIIPIRKCNTRSILRYDI
jgi:hypothetical protein